MMSSYIEFPGIRSEQAGRPKYASTWPITMAIRLTEVCLTRTLNDPVQLRDNVFIKALANRFAQGAEPAFYEPLHLGVIGSIEFVPTESQPTLGMIRIESAASIEILDGLHRLAALHIAKLPQKRIRDIAVPILITAMADGKRVRRLRDALNAPFLDKPKAVSERKLQSVTVREIARDSVALSEFLSRAIDLRDGTIAARSSRLFTLRAYARACVPLLDQARTAVEASPDEFLASYWSHLSRIIEPWRLYADNQMVAGEIRSSTVLALTSTLGALALLGSDVMSSYPDSWKERLSPLARVNWGRSVRFWEGLLLARGKPLKGTAVAEAAYRAISVAVQQTAGCENDKPPNSNLRDSLL
jgi:DNA sulfur modification protein DndB